MRLPPFACRKRLKLDLGSASAGPPSVKKRKLFEFRTARLRKVTSAYRDNMGELFFLTTGTNVTDNLLSFRRKPTQQFVNFLRANDAPARVISEVQTAVLGQQQLQQLCLTPTPAVALPPPRRPPVAYSPRLPSGVLSPVKVGEQLDVFSNRLAPARPATSLALPPISAPIYSPEQVAERVKQEGWVTRRVAELARDGLWPERRLPRVAERPRALSAWGLVLEEMKWLSADFQQERAWKKAAARVQSSACREAVVRRQEERQARLLEEGSEEHRRSVARGIAGEVQDWWAKVARLERFEARRRCELVAERQLVQQAAVVAELAPTLCFGGKRKLVEEIEEHGENGVSHGSDSESTISEQEAWELAHCVDDDEVAMLEVEACLPLPGLCKQVYPGYEEDVRERWEAEEEEESDWEESGDEAQEDEEPVIMDALLRTGSDRSVKSETGCDLGALSARAATLAPKPSPSSGPSPLTSPRKSLLEEHQTAGAEWLQALHAHNLPGLLADEPGLGRKATVAAFLSSLPRSSGVLLLACPLSSLSAWQSALATHAPALPLLTYSGAPADRRRLREEIIHRAPGLVITSYRSLFLDAAWFQSRSWEMLLLAEAQNVISAGSFEQLRTLVGLRAKRQRVLLVSGQQKENPIDLWNTVFLLFPGVMRAREEQGEQEVEVEGTEEYQDTVTRLQTFLASFTLTRSRSKCQGGGGEGKVWLNLSPGQRSRYEDYLAKQDTQVSSFHSCNN